jgi:hypothetical protein
VVEAPFTSGDLFAEIGKNLLVIASLSRLGRVYPGHLFAQPSTEARGGGHVANQNERSG